MTEPVPGQTPEPAVTDAAAVTPPAADPSVAEQQPTEPTAQRPETPPTDAAATGPEPVDAAATGPTPAESKPAPAEPAEPEQASSEAAGAEATGPEATEPEATGPEAQAEGGAGAGTVPPNPQELFGSLSLSAIEADIDRLMNDKMSQLDGMLAGLEDLVQRLEGEITNLEPPPDDPTTPTTP
jgi:hypothetical protein